MKDKDGIGIIMLIVSIILFILNFLLGWYRDVLLDNLFVFQLIPEAFVFLLNIVVILVASIMRKNNKTKLTLIAIIIIIISLILRFIFPFRNVKTIFELYVYEDERLEIIEKVKNNEIEIDEDGNADLPKKLKKLSSDREITVYQNDEDGQVICFWIFRGMLSGSHQLMYSSGGEKLIKENETGHPIINIKKLKENWYYVDTDY